MDRLTQRLYDLAGISGQDDECGDCSMCGFWAARFNRTSGKGGHILIEDDQGFKESESYDTTEELEARWQELLELSNVDDDSNDDSDSD
jgi:hypothetical protein